jgi:catechol 2,3-dioxygenase-like lactoylglutathione lyase family enzyme
LASWRGKLPERLLLRRGRIDSPIPGKRYAQRFTVEKTASRNKSRKLFPEDFLNLAEFALRFAADFLGRATILQIRIARRPAGRLLNFALCLLNSSLNPILRARFHPQTIRARRAARPSQSGLQFSRCTLMYSMSVQVYGCNHVAIEVDDIRKAIAFYQDVFNLEKLDRGEGDAFFKLGEHQFLAIFEVKKLQPANMRHFGIMVRDEQQLAEVRKKITGKYKLKLEPPFRCDFRDPWGNRIQVVDLRDESLIWMLPYREVQKAGIEFAEK